MHLNWGSSSTFTHHSFIHSSRILQARWANHDRFVCVLNKPFNNVNEDSKHKLLPTDKRAISMPHTHSVCQTKCNAFIPQKLSERQHPSLEVLTALPCPQISSGRQVSD